MGDYFRNVMKGLFTGWRYLQVLKDDKTTDRQYGIYNQ